MKFIDAVHEALAMGLKISREGWMPGAVIEAVEVVRGSKDFVILKEIDGVRGRAPWSPKLADLTADDWEIYVPKPVARPVI